jgi:DNA-directed RNA polymerase specialized sigma24 family protein
VYSSMGIACGSGTMDLRGRGCGRSHGTSCATGSAARPVDRGARGRLGIASVAYDEAIDELLAKLDAEERHDELGAALGELPLEQRDAVVRRVVLERDYRRLAGASAKESAVRARVSRGLRALRIRLSGGRP